MNLENNEKPNVMIVDDTPANLGLLEDILCQHGFNVAAFPRGAMALQAAAKEPPDLILLNIIMPEMDGFEVCQRLKADEVLKNIPVIFISALNDTDSKLKAFSKGGVDYVTKPFQEEEVLARVKTHLNMRRMQRELEKHNLNLEEKVRQRTKLLQARNEIHSMMIDDMDFAKVIRRVCIEIAKEFNIECLFIDVPFMDMIFSNKSSCVFSSDLARLSMKAQQTSSDIKDDYGCAIVLSSDDVTQGIFLSDNIALFDSDDKGWLSLVTICLMQARSMKESPELSEAIDRIIGDL